MSVFYYSPSIVVERPTVAGAFAFSFRSMASDQLAKGGAASLYYDWLASLSNSLLATIPAQYTHAVDLKLGTIGTLEAYIIAAFGKLSPRTEADTIRALRRNTTLEGFQQHGALMHADLRAYIFPLQINGVWPGAAKPRYIVNENVASAISRLRQLIRERSAAELVPIDESDLVVAGLGDNNNQIPAVQDALLLSLLYRLQAIKKVRLNNSRHVVVAVDQVMQYGRLISPELATYLWRSNRLANPENSFVKVLDTPIPLLPLQPPGPMPIAVVPSPPPPNFTYSTTQPAYSTRPMVYPRPIAIDNGFATFLGGHGK
jgi:hypothetical protein